MHVNDLLKIAVERGASDLHLKAGSCPMMRVRGELIPVAQDRRLDHDDMAAIAAAVLPTALRERFKETHEVDLAHSIPGIGRFRCHAFQQRGTIGMTFRVLPMRVPTLDELALPPVLRTVVQQQQGLVLVTGSTGCGKSTTLASMIDEINSTQTAHVMTIEDPIEYLHRDKRSIVCQREVGVDTASVVQALRSVLRQDSNVIVVGDMGDAEIVDLVLLAAETGHLVFSTLHTLDAAETVNRIVTMFPPHRQQQVRITLAAVLKAVMSQRLIAKADGKGRVPAVEVMITTPFIRECIVDGDRTHLIGDAIAQGDSGAQTFEQSIGSLYEQGLIDKEEATRWSSADSTKRGTQPATLDSEVVHG